MSTYGQWGTTDEEISGIPAEPQDGSGLGGTVGGGTSAGGDAPATNDPLPDAGPAYTPPPADPLEGCWKNPAIPGTLTGTVQRFEDLPATPADGLLYKVVGSAETAFSSYYVVSSGGVWNETRAPALANQVDPLTMPHALVRQADGTFVFKPFCWKPRSVGDATSNPAPAFVGRTIRDVFFYQNRLGFLADETAVFSVVGDYGNFWRRTVLDYLDGDVLPISASTTDVALLNYAVAFNDGIMLFSDQRQFSISNGESGTSINSIEINPVTDYTLVPGVRPTPVGDQVYFASEEGGYTAIQEYTRLDGRDAQDAADVTAHVAGLLPPGVSQLISLKGLNGLVVVVSKSVVPDRLYVYQYYWDGDRKDISAWRRWAFPGGQVMSGTFYDGVLTLLVRRQNKTFLEKIDLRGGARSEGQDHLLYLDRQVTLTGVYDSGTDKTTFTFPYDPDPATLRLLRSPGSVAAESIIPGSKITVTGDSVLVDGDESAHPVTAGEIYRTAVRLSRQYPQDYQGRPLESGRLQIRAMSITTTQTPFFTVEIRPYGPHANLDDASKTRIYNIAGQRVGNAGFTLGSQAYTSGATPFDVGADASICTITLANDTPFASNFVSAEWEGLYFSRAR